MTKKHFTVTLLSLGFMAYAAKPSPDQTFMMKAAEGGMAEVEMGKLAMQKGQSQEVKDFGKKMVTDHSKANQQLKMLASKKGVSLPATPSAKDMALKQRLSKMSAAEFDRSYIEHMVEDHKEDIADFQKEADSGQDTDVKAWAAKTLPTLQGHLQMAMQDQK